MIKEIERGNLLPLSAGGSPRETPPADLMS